LVWQLGGDWTVLLGGGRALLLQVAHPAVGAGVEAEDHGIAENAARPLAALEMGFFHHEIQDAAYQSLLRSKRQSYHRRIAQVLAKLPRSSERSLDFLVRPSP